MKIGYIRVSSKDQIVDRQVKKMKELGIEERFIFIDVASGKDFNRPRYEAMKLVIREGDIIYTDALDRFGRNYDEIIKEWKYITRELNADIVVLENKDLFNSRKFKEMGDIGKVLEDQFLSLFSYVAEQERKKIRQRQKEGMVIARAKGKQHGRPRIVLKEFETVYSKWKNGEITGLKATEILGISPHTFYRRVKEIEESEHRVHLDGQ